MIFGKICTECNLENKSRYKNFCNSCYVKQHRIKNPESYQKLLSKIREKRAKKTLGLEKKCSDCGITSRSSSKTFCNACYRKNFFKNNENALEKRRLRNRNSHRRKKGIDLNLPRLRGENGKGHLTKQGYKVIIKYGHPNAYKLNGCILEHVFVMSSFLERPLYKNELVHHKNGIRDDNRIENLELWHKGHPTGQRVQDKIKWCKEFLSKYDC